MDYYTRLASDGPAITRVGFQASLSTGSPTPPAPPAEDPDDGPSLLTRRSILFRTDSGIPPGELLELSLVIADSDHYGAREGWHEYTIADGAITVAVRLVS